MIKKQFFSFCIVGTIGFTIDCFVFHVLHHFVNPIFSRSASIGIGMTITWLLNRSLTFKMQTTISWREWLRYFSVNGTGALLNLSIFTLVFYQSPIFQHYFIIPIAIATSVSMWFNFFMSRFYVFKS
ncbi:MAG: GtrA family protein [uncultured bacterium]|nr:MAG: GtrA family protein [uncultured bacterium]OGT25527.1 MAG: hypothetical protein A3B71_05675 [Gammaproteobacteria bacterium RIFCSPHIGHO2_02_FULL_42_43]OGT28441.1 MAG: hypothetical protein A2624_01180 [Gammaproteobacteria bacterium RIFCSPHIGHO2_01_FULL_42_8]OGT51481.1 MAG: hypothetical protein A3E54_05440 [Gammaproteobacteria bacterium RIFCSPHIGHO2_12_FULL_41_25]OGT62182.1 MAG: hypothetical protein A3I77_04375 [Gammaproteobacteria bacterium RIFCSPLOWO2_02_FULL_42_14]OGT85855.1 MAG: hypoth